MDALGVGGLGGGFGQGRLIRRLSWNLDLKMCTTKSLLKLLKTRGTHSTSGGGWG
jgi:hypothetical protein